MEIKIVAWTVKLVDVLYGHQGSTQKDWYSIGSENKLVCSIDIAVIQIKMLVLYSIGQYALLVIQCG